MKKMRKRIRARYTMEATVIATGKTISWIVNDHPDLAGLKSGYPPHALHACHVQGAPNRRAV